MRRVELTVLNELRIVADAPGVVCTRIAGLAGLVAALVAVGCTKPNPAFKLGVRVGDSGVGDSGSGGSGDARGDRAPDSAMGPDGGSDGLPVPGDSSPPPDTAPSPDAAPDAPPSVDLPPDLPAPPPDLRPDLPPDLPPAVNLEDHLKAHWQFNEPMGTTQINDRIGNNTGTLQNGASLLASGIPNAGTGNRAARFQGNDDHMSIINRSLPRLEVTKSITVWINPDTLSHTGMRTIVALATDNDSSGIQIGTEGGRPGIWRWGNNTAQVKFNGTWTDRWYHLVYIYESDRHTLYVDGALVGSVPNIPVSGPVGNAVLGCYDAGILGSEMYEGLLDDLRIYDKVLSQTEIDRLQQGE